MASINCEETQSCIEYDSFLLEDIKSMIDIDECEHSDTGDNDSVKPYKENKKDLMMEQCIKDMEELLSPNYCLSQTTQSNSLSSNSQEKINIKEESRAPVHDKKNMNKHFINLNSQIQHNIVPQQALYNCSSTVNYNCKSYYNYYQNQYCPAPAVIYPQTTYPQQNMSPYIIPSYIEYEKYNYYYLTPNKKFGQNTVYPIKNINSINFINSSKPITQAAPAEVKEKVMTPSSDPSVAYLQDLNSKLKIVQYICSHKGCKDIQRKLLEFSQEAAQYLLELIIEKDGLYRVITDPCANYVFQKAYEVTSSQFREYVIKSLTSKSLLAGNDVFGSHSIQNMILQMSTTSELVQMNVLILQSYKVLCFNKNGIHIILKFLSQVCEEKRKNLNYALLSILNQLVFDTYGVSAVSYIVFINLGQKILEYYSNYER